jgi:hypothetical protein
MDLDIDIYNDDVDTKIIDNLTSQLSTWLDRSSFMYFDRLGVDWYTFLNEGIIVNGGYLITEINLSSFELYINQDLSKNGFNAIVSIHSIGREWNIKVKEIK